MQCVDAQGENATLKQHIAASCICRAGKAEGYANPPGDYDLALLLISQLECFGNIQPSVLVLAVQAVASRCTLPGGHHTVHHIPHIWPCQQ